MSPDMVSARVDWNRLNFVTFRGGKEAAVTLKGRFLTGGLASACCARVRVAYLDCPRRDRREARRCDSR